MISIVMPTVQPKLARDTMALAQLTAGCETRPYLVVDGKRRGFSRTVNAGWKSASGDVLILNDDIEWFQYGWLRILWEALYDDPSYGLVGPSGRSSTRPMCDGWPGQHGTEIVDHLPFWCVLVKEAVTGRIGHLDERFIHYGSDNYYCQVAKQAGYQCVWVRDVYLKHTHHGSGLITHWKEHDDLIWRSDRIRLR